MKIKAMLVFSVVSLIGLLGLSAYAADTTTTTDNTSNFYQAQDCKKADIPVCGLIMYTDGSIGVKDFPNLCSLVKEEYYKPLFDGNCSIVNSKSYAFAKVLFPGVMKELNDKKIMKKGYTEKLSALKSYVDDFTKEIKPLKDKDAKTLSSKEQRTIDVIEGVIINFKVLKFAVEYAQAI